jgi:hypothetical protein
MATGAIDRGLATAGERTPALGWVLNRWRVSAAGIVRATIDRTYRFGTGAQHDAAQAAFVRRRAFAHYRRIPLGPGDAAVAEGGLIDIPPLGPTKRSEGIFEGAAHLCEGRFAPLHVPVRYAFDLRLLPISGELGCWESLMQWHGVPNHWLGDRNCHPPAMLMIRDDRLRFAIRASARLVRNGWKRAGPRGVPYDRRRGIDLGPAAEIVGRWTHWEIDFVLSYDGAEGRISIRRDGALLAEDAGPNCFNDLRGGPYWKVGAYVGKTREDGRGGYAFWPRQYRDLACRVVPPPTLAPPQAVSL